MKRLVLITLTLLVLLGVLYTAYHYGTRYWIHRYDPLILRQAEIYHLDPDLVWSIIYEETYFRPWKKGKNGEIGLMQVTPAVARAWAAETGMHDLERQMNQNLAGLMNDPERNIQVGCWYLEESYETYRDQPGAEARMIAAYNAGPSRANDWNHTSEGAPPLSESDFIARIDIPSTRAYVVSILERYRKVKATHTGIAPDDRVSSESLAPTNQSHGPNGHT